MTDQQISAFINILRVANQITPLEKDILDTWDALQKKPFDTEVAHKQVFSNNANYPELCAAISAIPGVVQKPYHALTQKDMMFSLRCQLDGLAAKEMEARLNGTSVGRI